MSGTPMYCGTVIEPTRTTTGTVNIMYATQDQLREAAYLERARQRSTSSNDGSVRVAYVPSTQSSYGSSDSHGGSIKSSLPGSKF